MLTDIGVGHMYSVVKTRHIMDSLTLLFSKHVSNTVVVAYCHLVFLMIYVLSSTFYAWSIYNIVSESGFLNRGSYGYESMPHVEYAQVKSS